MVNGNVWSRQIDITHGIGAKFKGKPTLTFMVDGTES